MELTDADYAWDPDRDAAIVTYDGRQYEVRIVRDDDITPYDAECYTPEDVRAWKLDDWWYVGVIVTSEAYPELTESLWGVEFNFPLLNGKRTGLGYAVKVRPVPDLVDTLSRQVIKRELADAVQAYAYS